MFKKSTLSYGSQDNGAVFENEKKMNKKYPTGKTDSFSVGIKQNPRHDGTADKILPEFPPSLSWEP